MSYKRVTNLSGVSHRALQSFFEGSAFSWRMASNNFGAEMTSERWSLESTVINTSSVTVVEGEAGEVAICGVR